MEHVLVGMWRAVGVPSDACRAGVVDEWAPAALALPSVQHLVVAMAVDDQGPYARTPDAHGLVPNADALLALGLERAHDLDDVPARDLLHHVARRVEVWRVDVHRPKRWDRTWPDGEAAPGIKMVSFVRRAEGLTHQQFARHWTQRHAPLAVRHHVGLWDYTQNVARRAFTTGGEDVDGIAELHFRTREDFEQRFYDSDEGRAVIVQDVARFVERSRSEATLMTELPLRTAPSAA